MADSPISSPTGRGRVTTPTDFPEVNPRTAQAGHDFTLQAVMEMQRTLASLGTKVDRLLDDRKDDRADYRSDLKDLRAELQGLREKDIASVRQDLEKLKLGWAKIAGGAAIIAALIGFLADVVRAKITG